MGYYSLPLPREKDTAPAVKHYKRNGEVSNYHEKIQINWRQNNADNGEAYKEKNTGMSSKNKQSWIQSDGM